MQAARLQRSSAAVLDSPAAPNPVPRRVRGVFQDQRELDLDVVLDQMNVTDGQTDDFVKTLYDKHEQVVQDDGSIITRSSSATVRIRRLPAAWPGGGRAARPTSGGPSGPTPFGGPLPVGAAQTLSAPAQFEFTRDEAAAIAAMFSASEGSECPLADDATHELRDVIQDMLDQHARMHLQTQLQLTSELERARSTTVAAAPDAAPDAAPASRGMPGPMGRGQLPLVSRNWALNRHR